MENQLSPALASILGMSPQVTAPPQNVGLSSGMSGGTTFMPQYAQGGMIGAGGMPAGVGVNTSGQGSSQISPQMLEMHVNQFAQQHPQEVAKLKQTLMQLVSSGQVTQQELNTMVQLATVAAQNPEMYPQIRKFAIQQGLATEQDLPPQYDQGLVYVLLVVAKAIQQGMGGQNMMQGQPTQSLARGGAVNGGHPDGPVSATRPAIIEAHEGEYVIPEPVVRMKGREFFDNLVEKYKGV